MANLPADRTKLALAQSNQNPLNVLGSAANKNALTEAYDTLDLLYGYTNGLISAGTLSKLGIINVKDYGASGSALATTGSITSGSFILTLTAALDFVNGQGISIAGAGVAGATLVTSIANGAGTTQLTLNNAASTTVASVSVNHDDYAALNTLFNTTLTTAATVVMPGGTYILNTNLTIPSYINLIMLNGAMLSPVTGKTVTINGEFQAGMYQISTGAGTIAGAPRVEKIYPEWWGAKGNGVTDDTAAILAAVTFAGAMGGGIVFFSAAAYLLSSTLTMAKNVTLQGTGKVSTSLHFTHTGDGIRMSSTINTSTAVNCCIRDMKITNTNAANTGGGIVDVGGSFWLISNVWISGSSGGWKYGIILDQTELAEIDLCNLDNCSTGGIWLVNGPDHTPSAAQRYTNRITITRSQLNVNSIGIIDDGGYAHTFENNNLNGGTNAIRLAGVITLRIKGCEFEQSTVEPCLFTNVSQSAGTNVGDCKSVIIESNVMTAPSTFSCIKLLNGEAITIISNYFSSGALPAVNGAVNVFSIFSMGNYTETGNPVLDANATQTFTADSRDGYTRHHSLRVREGSNARQGTAVLVAGSVVVSNTNVTANSRIFLTSQIDGGAVGFLRVSTRTVGTSFTITSSSGTDTSTVAYEIFEPA